MIKVTLKRDAGVTDGSLIQVSSANIAEPLSGGELVGIAEGCRSIQVQESPESPVETINVCEVVIDGSCQALLSGSAPAIGGVIYASGSRVSITASGSPIGRLLPRGWSDTSGYNDGDLVTVLICGVH